MGAKAPYKTRQQGLILEYLASLGGRHTTAAQITRVLRGAGAAVGAATIYRQLEKLTRQGLVRKYTLEGEAGACYEYLPAGEGCHEHLHLKCEGCGTLVHLECGQAEDFQAHIQTRHGFALNQTKTVLYGLCAHCRQAPAHGRG